MIYSFNSLMKYVREYKNDAKKMKTIKEKFAEYIKLCNKENLMLFINEIRSIPGIDETLYYNSDSIRRKFGMEAIMKITREMDAYDRLKYISEMYEACCRPKYYTVDEFFEDLIKYNEKEYIIKHMDEIVMNGDMHTWIDNGFLKKLEALDSQRFAEIHSAIVCKMTGVKPWHIDDATLSKLTIMIDEISKAENIDISNLEYIGKGEGEIYKLGNKVIMFGRGKLIEENSDNKLMVKTLIRKQIPKSAGDLYIEVSECVSHDKAKLANKKVDLMEIGN